MGRSLLVDLVDDRPSERWWGEAAPMVLALEPRLMFDGAAVATVAETASDDGGTGDGGTGDGSGGASDPAAAPSGGGSGLHQVFVVDAVLANEADLLAAIPAGAEVIVLDAGRDGVLQVADALAGRDGIDALHILSHGGAGQVGLGNAVLSAETLDRYGATLGDWGAALSEDGDILFYGCDIGAGATGMAFVESLAALSGADIAASNDATGAAVLGGDWDLEVTAGPVEAVGLATASPEVGAWNGVLATTYIDGTEITALKNDDDAASGAINIGFTFTFFGVDYTQLYVTSNGLVQFGGAETNFSNEALDGSSLDYPTIAAFWDDLASNNNCQKVHYHMLGSAEAGNTYGKDVFVVQWTTYGFYSSAAPVGTFQVILIDDDTDTGEGDASTDQVVLSYRSLQTADRSLGQSATIGLDSDDGSTFVQFSNETASLTPQRGIKYTPDGSGSYTTAGLGTNDYFEGYLYDGALPAAESALTSLADGSTDVALKPAFTWDAAANVSSYNLKVATDTAFNNVVINESGAALTSFTATSDLNQNTTYYWAVINTGNDGCTVWSEVRSFTTLTNHAPTSADASLTVTDGQVGAVATGKFTFTDVDNDTLSQIQVTAVPAVGTLFVDANGNNAVDGGEALANDGTVSKANLDAGRLKYLTSGNGNGTALATFSFKVNDGTVYSAAAYTMTINVNPAPVVTKPVVSHTTPPPPKPASNIGPGLTGATGGESVTKVQAPAGLPANTSAVADIGNSGTPVSAALGGGATGGGFGGPGGEGANASVTGNLGSVSALERSGTPVSAALANAGGLGGGAAAFGGGFATGGGLGGATATGGGLGGAGAVTGGFGGGATGAFGGAGAVTGGFGGGATGAFGGTGAATGGFGGAGAGGGFGGAGAATGGGFGGGPAGTEGSTGDGNSQGPTDGGLDDDTGGEETPAGAAPGPQAFHLPPGQLGLARQLALIHGRPEARSMALAQALAAVVPPAAA